MPSGRCLARRFCLGLGLPFVLSSPVYDGDCKLLLELLLGEEDMLIDDGVIFHQFKLERSVFWVFPLHVEVASASI